MSQTFSEVSEDVSHVKVNINNTFVSVTATSFPDRLPEPEILP